MKIDAPVILKNELVKLKMSAGENWSPRERFGLGVFPFFIHGLCSSFIVILILELAVRESVCLRLHAHEGGHI